MNSAKAKVKGSPVYRMKVVPHRPLKNTLITLLLLALAGAALVATYLYAQNKANSEGLSVQEAQELRSQLDKLNQQVSESKRELAKYQLNAQAVVFLVPDSLDFLPLVFFARPGSRLAASASNCPPISPIITTQSVSESLINNSKASFVVVPIIGSPPIPIAVETPNPAFTT